MGERDRPARNTLSGRVAAGVADEALREPELVESVLDDLVDVALAIDTTQHRPHADLAQHTKGALDRTRSSSDERVRDLDTQIRGRDPEIVDDLGEIALDVDVPDQSARQVPVRARAQTAPRRAGRCRGSPTEHGEVDHRKDRRVRHNVDELFRVE